MSVPKITSFTRNCPQEFNAIKKLHPKFSKVKTGYVFKCYCSGDIAMTLTSCKERSRSFTATFDKIENSYSSKVKRVCRKTFQKFSAQNARIISNKEAASNSEDFPIYCILNLYVCCRKRLPSLHNLYLKCVLLTPFALCKKKPAKLGI